MTMSYKSGFINYKTTTQNKENNINMLFTFYKHQYENNSLISVCSQEEDGTNLCSNSHSFVDLNL